VTGPGGSKPDDGTDERRPPEQRYREPEEDPFDVTPDIPEVPDPSTADVDPEVQRRFWALVAVFNVALLVTSLGVLFVVFDGAYVLGGQLLLAGLVAFGVGFYRYRSARRRVRAVAENSEDDTSDHSTDRSEDA